MTPEGVLIIGYGSPLRGDDAAGPEAARRLSALGVPALDVHQLTPELAEGVAAARTVIFLDAHAGVAPGEISVEALDCRGGGFLEHYATSRSLLRLAHTIRRADRPARAWLIGLGGENFELHEGLSPAAEHAVAAAVQAVLALVAS